ncbi:RagB/SusD family nutrient uptake outer membrane protein [Maribellus maritimus]|uniref:RagB/SusD family nutrient uptake outer membrane protein n=1 Tax=Maribellus maritimus TaxID=2870838 RepID=UPI001EEC5E80|nr:RagB/SusD family nutrient uptake outer membrane protein [Maribellus maritimus]MCG6187342.1 RagB/SusD family nutrient uptake outer membrane protein [Maribellus maritimus]
MKNLIYILFAPILFLGCQDFDLTPEHQLSDGSLWDKSEHYKAGVNILYPSIGSHSDATDNDSDFSYALGPNNISNGSRDVPASSNFYNNSYRDIRRCNFIIDRAIENGFESDRYVAEARWFRALFYFRLVEAYGDIPFYTKTLDPSSEELFDTRTPRKEVVDFILQELKEVSELLPEQSQLDNSELGRITKGAANALRARVALFEGTWIKYHGTPGDANERFDQAITASKAVIDSKEYSLFSYESNPEQSYRYFFMEVGNDSKEQIVARRYDLNNYHGFSLQVYEGFNSSTRKLADLYLCKDGLPINKSPLYEGRQLMISEYENRDSRMTMTIIPPGYYAIDRLDQEGTGQDFPEFLREQTLYTTYKFLTEFYVDQTGHRGVFYYHMLRYAEVLLIYAEALYEKNDGITDAQLGESINIVRARAGMPNLTNDFISQNGLDIKTEIRRERSIELAHEGFRRSDLRRWKTAEIEMPMAIRGVQFKNTEYETAILEDGTLRYPYTPSLDNDGNIIVEPEDQRSFKIERDYLEPIPSEELLKNPNLAQNPNW